jgi:hypothetical protein
MRSGTTLLLRYKAPGVHRAYRLPGSGNAVMWVLVSIVFRSGSARLVALVPGTLEPLLGVSYDVKGTWGVSRLAFHTLTLGTLLVMFAVAVGGFLAGKAVRARDVTAPIQEALPTDG